MRDKLQTVSEKRIHTVVRKQRLSIMNLKRMKNQLVFQNTLLKKRLEEEKQTEIELSKELEKMEEKLKINEQGFWNYFKNFMIKKEFHFLQ